MGLVTNVMIATMALIALAKNSSSLPPITWGQFFVARFFTKLKAPTLG